MYMYVHVCMYYVCIYNVHAYKLFVYINYVCTCINRHMYRAHVHVYIHVPLNKVAEYCYYLQAVKSDNKILNDLMISLLLRYVR